MCNFSVRTQLEPIKDPVFLGVLGGEKATKKFYFQCGTKDDEFEKDHRTYRSPRIYYKAFSGNCAE